MTISIYYDRLTDKLNTFTNSSMPQQSVVGVYIMCNEAETEKTQQVLEHDKINNGCHIGFSSWHNFDIMAIRKPERAILCDFNPQTKEFLDASLICVNYSHDRFTFANYMGKFVQQNRRFFSINVKKDEFTLPEDEIKQELTRGGSWLASDDGFSYIKKLALEGKIATITEDIRNNDKFGKISKLLKDNEIPIDTVYISNINEYMHEEEDKNKFIATVNHLFTFNTTLIYCKKDLIQTTIKGSDFFKEKIKVERNDLFG
jgi:hypothetical protein